MEMTTSVLAKHAGVNLQTLRYYERRGLLFPVRRKSSGYRVYDGQSLKVLKFIRRAQSLGFTLRETGDLLGLEARNPASCGKVLRRAREKVEQIRKKVEALKRMEGTLNRLMADCRCLQTSGPCPVVECFDEGGKPCGPKKT